MRETTRRARALAVVAVAATSLVGVVPTAVAASSDTDDERPARRGYVCDRLERDDRAVVGSSRCQAVNTPRHGTIRGDFVIESRGKHVRIRVLCKGRPGHASGYANVPKWVRGNVCQRV